MSKPFASDLFSFRGRRNRKSYIAASCLVHLPAMLGAVLITTLGIAMEDTVGPSAGSIVYLSSVAIYIGVAISGYAIAAQRWHDIGRTGWLSLLLLIPYVNLAVILLLMVLEGTSGDNKYGADPLEFHRTSFPQSAGTPTGA